VNGDTVVVDSSVLVAIFKLEPDSSHLIQRLVAYKRRVISAATWLESAMVCENVPHPGGELEFAEIVTELSLETIPLTPAQARLALEAFKQFGKGRGAKASLNFGDCFVYALAKEFGAPVLFKGNDFTQTDIAAA
jgi:ribonuclease VapC